MTETEIRPPSNPSGHLPPRGGKDAEIWFYHLERSSLSEVLHELLDKTLQRGWRALVRASDGALLREMSDRLWTARPDSFLAHGLDGEGKEARQPILLTTTGENRNGAQALFILDQAELGATEDFERCFILFDGRDDVALAAARERWRGLKQTGGNLAYWKQSTEGRWEKAG